MGVVLHLGAGVCHRAAKPAPAHQWQISKIIPDEGRLIRLNLFLSKDLVEKRHLLQMTLINICYVQNARPFLSSKGDASADHAALNARPVEKMKSQPIVGIEALELLRLAFMVGGVEEAPVCENA